jgi:hypothetical protein
MDLIIYHKSCPDGFCAALIAKKRYPESELLGMNHGTSDALDILLPRVAGKNVLMVDFTLRTRAENIALNEAAASFHIFDHHKTAKAELEGLDFVTFDVTRSGAGITWDELFGKFDQHFFNTGIEIRLGPNREYIGMPETQRPWYVDYIEDRDLWNHKLPKTKEINAFIMTLPHTEIAWRVLDGLSSDAAAGLGCGALAHVDNYVREIVEHRRLGKMGIGGTVPALDVEYPDCGYTVAVVNAPYLNCSEVGNVLCSLYADIGMSWFERGDGIVQFSLRSNGDVDVSKIAKRYNGGGHMHAAGFQMPLFESRKFIDSILGR